MSAILDRSTPPAAPDLNGAEPVGALAQAPDPERRFVTGLRLWLAGPHRRAEAEAALTAGLDPGRAARAAAAFDAYLGAIAAGALRRLWRHAPGCPCLGRDEALLSGAMREAAAGDREAAWAILTPAIRAAALFETAEAAGALGRALAPPRRLH
jgi:hypothetical protein